MKRSLLTIALCLTLLLSLLSGCGASTPSITEEPTTAKDAVAESIEEAEAHDIGEEDTSSEEVESAAEVEEEATVDLTDADAHMDYSGRIELMKSLHSELPISQSGESLSLWLEFEPSNLQIAGLDELINQQTFQMSMEQTGVNLDLVWVDINNGAEKFDLLVASGDWPDISKADYFASGIENAYAEEIVMDLSDLIPECAPNYYALISSDRNLLDAVTATSGELLSFCTLRDQCANPANQGAFIRQDWLDDLNLEVPQTYDQLKDVLTAFKNEKGASEPIALYNSIVPESGSLIGGFGSNAVLATDTFNTITDAFYQVDGKVQYGAIADGTREFLTYLNELNNEGLMNFENMMNRDRNPFGELTAVACANGQVGYMYNNQPFGGVYSSMSEDTKTNWWPVADVTRTPDDINPFFEETSLVYSNGLFLFATCENPELACSWLDYFYSWEGYCMACYGIEGTDFVFDESGFPVFLADRAAEFDTVNAAMVFCNWADFAMVADNLKGFSYEERELQCFPVWSSNRSTEQIIGSKCVLDADESTKANAIYSDILTHISTVSLQFINGDLNIHDDAVWNNYVSEVEKMGILELTEIIQNAYDRAYGTVG